jgi:peroxiredoxin
VVEAYNKYHDKGFDVVGISYDSKQEAWVKAIDELKMPWTHLSDLKGWENVSSDLYGIKAIPANLLINPEGTIEARDLRGEALQQKLAEIFG